MSMEIQHQKAKIVNDIVIGGVSLLMVLVIGYLSTQQYEAYKQQVQTDKANQSAINAIREQRTIAQKAQRDADISRLVSVCMNAQQRYDASPKADQAKSVRPNCAISEQ